MLIILLLFCFLFDELYLNEFQMFVNSGYLFIFILFIYLIAY